MRLKTFLREPPSDLRQQHKELLESLVGAFLAGEEDRARSLADEWNKQAVRRLKAFDLYKMTFAMPRERLVDEALGAVPAWHDALTWDVALEAVGEALSAEWSERDTDFVWQMLEANFPGTEFINLVYWPNLWFGIEEMPELSSAQILAYAMARSGRRLANAPEVDLPRPAPPPPRGPIAL